jgi:cell division protein FtsA
MVGKDDVVEIPTVGGRAPRTLGKQLLCAILEPRVEEIFQLVHREIQRCGYADQIVSGVVITGGATLLQGMPEMAEDILGVPVRRGLPRGVGGLVDVVKSPMYATGVGLVVYGARNLDKGEFRVRSNGNTYKRIADRMREWLSEIF